MSTPTEQERQEFQSYCEQVTINQLHNVVEKEKAANRRVYTGIAEKVLEAREAESGSVPRQRGY